MPWKTETEGDLIKVTIWRNGQVAHSVELSLMDAQRLSVAIGQAIDAALKGA